MGGIELASPRVSDNGVASYDGLDTKSLEEFAILTREKSPDNAHILADMIETAENPSQTLQIFAKYLRS